MCKAIVGMANINAQEFQDISILMPPIELQNQFEALVFKAEALKKDFNESLHELENLFGSLNQRAFKGGLQFKNIPQKEIDAQAAIEAK